jgi:hypothetical protein
MGDKPYSLCKMNNIITKSFILQNNETLLGLIVKKKNVTYSRSFRYPASLKLSTQVLH